MDMSSAELKRVGSFNRGGGATEQEQADFLAIEDLLDFSNEDIGGSIESFDSHDSAPASSIILSCEEPKASSVSSAGSETSSKQHQALSLFEDVAGSGELCVPCDDLAELEWLSNFVEESFSSADGAVLEGVLLHDENVTRGGESKQGQRASPVSVLDHQRRGTHHSTSTTTSSNSMGDGHLSLSPDQIYLSRPGRARSKRRRAAVCFWNTRILSLTDDCNILEASSTSKLTSQHQSSSSSDSEGALALGYDDSDDFFLSPVKKVSCSSKVSKGASGSKGSIMHVKGSQQAASGDRRCLHCGSQRTPQWRAGPMGPKTLCNACGVRYKSGRLLPEYRPAASPTFVETIHSNSHRRVLEMRRQRSDSVFSGSHVDQLGVC
eukprot:c15555_g2_i1 orf=428-1564(-)